MTIEYKGETTVDATGKKGTHYSYLLGTAFKHTNGHLYRILYLTWQENDTWGLLHVRYSNGKVLHFVKPLSYFEDNEKIEYIHTDLFFDSYKTAK